MTTGCKSVINALLLVKGCDEDDHYQQPFDRLPTNINNNHPVQMEQTDAAPSHTGLKRPSADHSLGA